MNKKVLFLHGWSSDGGTKTAFMRSLGYDVMTQSYDVRRNIGYLPESVPLYPEMRVEEYIHYRAKLKGLPRRERLNRIDYCLERCRLKEVKTRLLGTLSKGYRQRVGLADAMVHNPPILILDEPTSGLDPVQIRETLNLIRELGESHTVLFSTHILQEVETICDRIIIIQKGRIALQKRLDEMGTFGHVLLEVRTRVAPQPTHDRLNLSGWLRNKIVIWAQHIIGGERGHRAHKFSVRLLKKPACIVP